MSCTKRSHKIGPSPAGTLMELRLLAEGRRILRLEERMVQLEERLTLRIEKAEFRAREPEFLEQAQHRVEEPVLHHPDVADDAGRRWWSAAVRL